MASKDQKDPKWAISWGSGKKDKGGRDVDRERKDQNKNGWKKNGKW